MLSAASWAKEGPLACPATVPNRGSAEADSGASPGQRRGVHIVTEQERSLDQAERDDDQHRDQEGRLDGDRASFTVRDMPVAASRYARARSAPANLLLVRQTFVLLRVGAQSVPHKVPFTISRGTRRGTVGCARAGRPALRQDREAEVQSGLRHEGPACRANCPLRCTPRTLVDPQDWGVS